jgi:hypothetical protein
VPHLGQCTVLLPTEEYVNAGGSARRAHAHLELPSAREDPWIHLLTLRDEDQYRGRLLRAVGRPMQRRRGAPAAATIDRHSYRDSIVGTTTREGEMGVGRPKGTDSRT